VRKSPRFVTSWLAITIFQANAGHIMSDKVQKIDYYVTTALSSLLLVVCFAVSLYQGGGLGLAFLACHCGVFILDGLFDQNRRIKGTFIGTVFFPRSNKKGRHQKSMAPHLDTSHLRRNHFV
jgi:hypothetical protein